MARRIINIEDDELWKEIKIRAIREGKTVSEYIEEILREAVGKR